VLQPAAGTFFPLGLYPHGDFGPWTIYVTKTRKLVHFLRAPPTSPPSWLQQRQRHLWSAAAAVWATMGEPAREWWHRVAAINHLKLSGYNLFIVYETGKDPSCLDALAMPS